MIRNLSIALLLSFVAACGGGGESEMVTKLESFKREVCACTTEACADAVNKKATEYTLSKIKDMSESDVEKLVGQLEGLEKEFNACYEKAAGHPPND